MHCCGDFKLWAHSRFLWITTWTFCLRYFLKSAKWLIVWVHFVLWLIVWAYKITILGISYNLTSSLSCTDVPLHSLYELINTFCKQNIGS